MTTTDERKTGTRLLAKMTVALLLVGVGHWAMFLVSGSSGIPPEILAFDGHLKEGADIVYFGDSTVVESVSGDTDTRGLATMLTDALPTQRVIPIAHYAYTPEVIAAYCALLAEAENPPHAVIIPINLRCFSPSWNRKPEWQFEKEKFLLKNYHTFPRVALRPLVVFGYLNLAPLSRPEFEATTVFFGNEPAGTVADFERSLPTPGDDASYSDHFMYEYGYRLDENHPQLAALSDAVQRLNDAGIKTLCYVTPIDFERGKRVVGTDFVTQVEENIELIKRVLSRAGSPPYDWSQRLSSNAFGYGDRIHEHLKETARAELVDSLINLLN